MAVALPDQEARRAWSAVLDRARTELPETTFLMWFTDVRPIGLTTTSCPWRFRANSSVSACSTTI